MRRLAGLVIVALFALVLARVVSSYDEMTSLRPLAEHYVTQGPSELGAANIVTAILITYRGFDTLGEVAVLFMAASGVGLLLKGGRARNASEAVPEPGEIVRTGAQILLPLIFVFGAYVIANGHLSAGGGFQGGAIVASGTMLMLLANPRAKLDTALLGLIESVSGLAYVGLALLGLILAGGFLDPRFLPAGRFGTLLSAGAIPLISALLGIKVGAELSVMIDRFRS